MGWTLSFQGRLEEATEECLRAIAIDPEFGNPHNDIGVYLMQRDKLDEAIPWFEKDESHRRDVVREPGALGALQRELYREDGGEG